MSRIYYKNFDDMEKEHINNLVRMRLFKLRKSEMYKFSEVYQNYKGKQGHSSREIQVAFLLDEESRVVPVREKLRIIMQNYHVPTYLFQEFVENSDNLESFIAKCRKWGGSHIY